jgi:hypothetical protein
LLNFNGWIAGVAGSMPVREIQSILKQSGLAETGATIAQIVLQPRAFFSA